MSSEEKYDLEASTPQSTLTDVPEATDIETNGPRQKSWWRGSMMAIRQKMMGKVDARIVSDAILGLSDGMTVPFALGASLTAFGTTRIVIVGGLAELIAGAISMGLGGYLGAQSISESYKTTERKCDTLIDTSPTDTTQIVEKCLQQYSMQEHEAAMLNHRLHESVVGLKGFLMRHHFETAQPETSRPYISALTLGLSYFIGGFIPLIPYLIVAPHEVLHGLWWSIGIMVVVLLVFGYVKTCVVRGWQGWENRRAGIIGGLQMLAIGTIAVGAAVGLVRALEEGFPTEIGSASSCG